MPSRGTNEMPRSSPKRDERVGTGLQRSRAAVAEAAKARHHVASTKSGGSGNAVGRVLACGPRRPSEAAVQRAFPNTGRKVTAARETLKPSGRPSMIGRSRSSPSRRHIVPEGSSARLRPARSSGTHLDDDFGAGRPRRLVPSGATSADDLAPHVAPEAMAPDRPRIPTRARSPVGSRSRAAGRTARWRSLLPPAAVPVDWTSPENGHDGRTEPLRRTAPGAPGRHSGGTRYPLGAACAEEFPRHVSQLGNTN